jgi:hypothetical protein
MNNETTPIITDTKLIDTNQTEEEEENIDIKRQKKREMEKYIQEIESKNEICHQLIENIKYEKDRIKITKNEINLRAERLKKLNEQYQAIVNEENLEMDERVTKIKKDIIKEKLDELLDDKIPEAGLKQKRNLKNLNENEFKDLIHESIQVIYTKYESPYSKLNKEEIKNFIISKYSVFSSLKETACSYWNLEPNEFILTDETESIIYNDNILINEFMKNYSVRSNIIRLIKINILKARIKILPSQEGRLKETNKLELKGKSEVKRGGGGSFAQIVSEFVKYYPNLKPYLLGKDPMDLDSENKDLRAKDLDTSFYMLVLCLLLFIFSILQLQIPQNDITINNKEIGYLKNIYSIDALGGNKNNVAFIFYYLFKCLRTVSHLHKEDYISLNDFEYPLINECLDFTKCKNKTNETEKYDCIIDTFKNCSEGIELNFLSSVHLIIEKVKEKECNAKMVERDKKCYHEKFTSGNENKNETLDEKEIEYFQYLIKENPKNELLDEVYKNLKHKSSKKAKITLNYETDTGLHSGGGYHMDLGKNKYSIINFFCILSELIPINYGFSFCYSNNFVNEKKELNRDYYFLVSENVRSIIVLFNIIYSADYDQFANVLFHFDLTAAGGILNPIFRVNTFIPNVYKNKGKLIIDILRLIIFIIIIILYALEFKMNKQKINFNFFKKILLSFHTLLLVLSFILYIGIFSLKLIYLTTDGKKYIEEKEESYYQGVVASKYFHYVNFLECILLIILVMKLLLFTQLIRFTNLFFRFMNKSLGMFIQYFIIIITCIIGFAFMGEITWGQYYNEYANFRISFIYTIYLIFGYYNIENIIEHIEWWGIIYIIILYVFNFVFINFIFSLVLAESLRRVVKRYGYPEDDKAYNWKIKDFVVWVKHYGEKNEEEIEK